MVNQRTENTAFQIVCHKPWVFSICLFRFQLCPNIFQQVSQFLSDSSPFELGALIFLLCFACLPILDAAILCVASSGHPKKCGNYKSHTFVLNHLCLHLVWSHGLVHKFYHWKNHPMDWHLDYLLLLWVTFLKGVHQPSSFSVLEIFWRSFL